MRFGLVGTGHWARIAHAPALASVPGVEFTAVWGRNRDATCDLAARYDVKAYDDFDSFLAAVEAVAFAVPPEVQGTLAMQAVVAGKHVLLEKPLAASGPAAATLAQAVRDAGVASVVFFTARFQPDVRTWLTDLADQGPWFTGSVMWLGSALLPSSPFNTPWRRVMGGLWDLAPHAVSLMWACLGPVRDVTADVGSGNVTHVVLRHDGGASSVVTTSLGASLAAARYEVGICGERGWRYAPALAAHPAAALRVALAELTDCALSGQVSHPCDAQFGRDVTLVIAEAQRQIASRRHGALPAALDWPGDHGEVLRVAVVMM